MEEEKKTNVTNNFEAGSNCQVFNGDVNNSIFAMPGSTVNQFSGQTSDEGKADSQPNAASQSSENDQARDEELFHFIHPSIGEKEEWQIHDEVKRLVTRQGLQEICLYLSQMAKDKKILLPQNQGKAYAELVRMGMPSGEGFNEKTFQKYYKH